MESHINTYAQKSVCMIEAGPLIVIIIRLLVSITIFKWKFWGAIAAAFFDLIDVVLIDILGMGDFANYSAVDKALDIYYVAFCLVVSLAWERMAKWTSIILFSYRAIGVIIFEFITPARILLFIFPNLFENWYLVWAFRNRYFPKWKLTVKRLVWILIACLIPKMIQEYILHWAQATPWNWLQSKTGLFAGGNN